MLRVFNVAAVDAAVIHDALSLAEPDFEDAATSSAANFAGCDAIVTRDRTFTPEAAAPLLAKT